MEGLLIMGGGVTAFGLLCLIGVKIGEKWQREEQQLAVTN
jgi:hypothetical protein